MEICCHSNPSDEKQIPFVRRNTPDNKVLMIIISEGYKNIQYKTYTGRLDTVRK